MHKNKFTFIRKNLFFPIRFKMDASYEKMRKDGHNTVDNLVKWLQEAKLIEKEKAAEDKAKKLFQDVKDQKNVDLVKFKEVVAKIAAENKKSGQEALSAVEAASKAFIDTLKKEMNK